MTGFMPPVRRMQVQSGEPNNLRVGFRRATLRVIAAHRRVAAALPRLRGQKTRPRGSQRDCHPLCGERHLLARVA
jgi:hypothetical protein